MISIADDNFLYFLGFTDRKDIENEIDNLKKVTNSIIINEDNFPIQSIRKELNDYFRKTISKFNTPIILTGSTFQKNVWNALKIIPYGKTASYSDIAKAINNPNAHRAVASAIGKNPLSIIIPCHRVILSNNALGGYNGGIIKKQFLIDNEL